MFQKDLFKDKIILVSGGRSGIGFSISKMFLEFGATVWIVSRKLEKLEKAAEELSAFGPCFYQACDIRNTSDIAELITEIKEKNKRLDILVNNAGGQFPSLAEDISEKGWNAVINNNLNGSWFMTQAMAKAFFIPKKSGKIINIIANIFRGFPGMAHTGAARAGIDNFTKSLAVEWSKYHININAIAPGIIKSTGLENYPEELVKGISDTIPAKRLGSTEEVASLVLYLASPMAAYITGETIYMDGGQRLWGNVFEV